MTLRVVNPAWIVIGLGNPGARYAATRHNAGFQVVDLLAQRAGATFEEPADAGRRVWIAGMRGGEVVLAKSRTFMNRTGRAAVALRGIYAIDPARLLVVYDDADLPLGRIRLRPEGGAGGHNGIRSLMDALGTGAFPRVRLGVAGSGRDERDLADYVLEPFSEDEREVARELVALGADAVQAVLDAGLESAMNRFNGRVAAPLQQSEEG